MSQLIFFSLFFFFLVFPQTSFAQTPVCSSFDNLILDNVVRSDQGCSQEAVCFAPSLDQHILFCNKEDDGSQNKSGDLPNCTQPNPQLYRSLTADGSCMNGFEMCFLPSAAVTLCQSNHQRDLISNEPDQTTPREIKLIEDTCQGDNCPLAKPVICGQDKVQTAIGCISTKPADLITALIKLIIGIGGGIALIRMIIGSIQLITAQGNQDQIKSGKEMFISAIIGLLFIIFAVMILETIGVSILGLPGLTS